MRLGLSMIVMNEADQIVPCLEGIRDVFDDVVIVDTGSSDGTVEILRDELGITPIIVEHEYNISFVEDSARNAGLIQVKSPWVFVLDADERVSRDALERRVGRRAVHQGVAATVAPVAAARKSPR